MSAKQDYTLGVRAQSREFFYDSTTTPEAKLPFSAHELLVLMATAREGDRREGILYRQGKGWLQVPGVGHEALAALVYALSPQDYIYPYYRQRAIALARGISNYEMALSFFAQRDSSSGGRQMSNHYSDPERRVVVSATLTGLQCLPAAGTAWACQREGKGGVVVCCIGDAAVRQGEFYEALCLACQMNLPLIFLVEDNAYGISTPTKDMTPWNIQALHPDLVTHLNGRHALEVYETGRHAINKARSGGGPTVLWAQIDRLLSHTASDDQRVYRSSDELDAMFLRDPIHLLRDELIRAGELTSKVWEEELEDIVRQVDADYRRAEQAAPPEPSRVAEHLFSSARLTSHTSHLPEQETWNMVGAVNETLRQSLEDDQRVLMFGEDIEDPKGGVFGLTKGLSSLFPGRVVNSPLAEATIAGTAVGLAVAGYKPVFEIQFVDFIGPAFNQIVNQIATLRWRSAGAWKCPLVFIMPCGAYLPAGGPWHSLTNESWFAHTPGLQIVMPSTPHDAASLLRAAIHGDDPVLFMLPKHLFRQKFSLARDEPIGLGQAAIRTYGSDVTVIAWGNCVEVALAAAEMVEKENVSVEVIDLRSIVPCDWNTLRDSIAKTGRFVVVQEDARTASFGQAIIAEMTSPPGYWGYLSAPPQLVSRPDVHIPFHPDSEAFILPSIDDVCSAIRLTMKY